METSHTPLSFEKIRWLATAVVQRPELETNRSVFPVPPPPLEQFSATFENFN